MSTRQFVAVRFNPWDRRNYTYHNDAEPVALGDKVIVDTARGKSIVEVVGLPDPPSFETKPIVGKAPPGEEPADETTEQKEM